MPISRSAMMSFSLTISLVPPGSAYPPAGSTPAMSHSQARRWRHPTRRAKRNQLVVEVVAVVVDRAADPFAGAIAQREVAARHLLQYPREILTAHRHRRRHLDELVAAQHAGHGLPCDGDFFHGIADRGLQALIGDVYELVSESGAGTSQSACCRTRTDRAARSGCPRRAAMNWLSFMGSLRSRGRTW